MIHSFFVVFKCTSVNDLKAFMTTAPAAFNSPSPNVSIYDLNFLFQKLTIDTPFRETLY